MSYAARRNSPPTRSILSWHCSFAEPARPTRCDTWIWTRTRDISTGECRHTRNIIFNSIRLQLSRRIPQDRSLAADMVHPARKGHLLKQRVITHAVEHWIHARVEQPSISFGACLLEVANHFTGITQASERYR